MMGPDHLVPRRCPHPAVAGRSRGALSAIVSLAAALGLAAVSGCTTVGPDFQPPALQAPAQWSLQHGGAPELAAPPQAQAALPEDRWSVFGDAELLRLQARARDASADVRIAALRVIESRAQERTVTAQRGVQVNAQGAVARQRQSEFGSASRLVGAIAGANRQPLLDALSSPFTLYQAGFDASWEPDLWGRVLRSEEVARATTSAQRAELRQVRLSVVAELARDYFSFRSEQRQLALVRDELAATHETYGLLQAQVDRGLLDESTLIALRNQEASLQELVPTLLAQQANAINQISLLCDADPGALNEELLRDATLTAPALPDLRMGLPSELAHRRPDVAAAESRLHAATAGIGIAVADLYPRVMLGASFGLESVGGNHASDWGSREWSVGPSLSIPIWDHGRRQTVVTLREIAQQEAAVSYQQAVRKAWHEVDGAVSTYLAESRRDAQLLIRIHEARDELALAQARYHNGMTSYLPVLSASMSLLDTQRQQSDSTLRVRTALATLYKALGDDPRAGTADE